MKHVIVIETADGDDGMTPNPISGDLQDMIVSIVDDLVCVNHSLCVVHSRFNVRSAIAAVHDMYGAPAWSPNDTPSR